MTAGASRLGPRPRDLIPGIAVAGGVAVVLLTIAVALAGRLGGIPSHASTAPVVEARQLRFDDRPDGTILITDADTGATVRQVAVGEGGFIRGTMRGLARDRGRRGAGAETPFLLERLEDGHLVLTDPVLERAIDLGAFGPTNLQTFAELLDGPAAGKPSGETAP